MKIPAKEWFIANWLRNYPAASVRVDIVAGLTTAAVVIPKAMADGEINKIKKSMP